MPVCDAKSIPAEVNSSTKDPEVAAFLKTGPVLGAQAGTRRKHEANWRPVVIAMSHTKRVRLAG